MSVEMLSVVLHHSQAKGTAKLVLIGIANHAGDGGAWPSLGTLAVYAGVDVRHVRRILRQLEEMGELRTHARAGGLVDTPVAVRPNRYDVLVRCPGSCAGGPTHRPVDNPRKPVDNSVDKSVDKSDPRTPTPGTPGHGDPGTPGHGCPGNHP